MKHQRLLVIRYRNSFGVRLDFKLAVIRQQDIVGPGEHLERGKSTEAPIDRVHQRIGQHFVPQRQDIPEAMPTQHHRLVGKAVYLFQAELSSIEAGQQYASASGTQIDCCHRAYRHKSPLFQREYAAAFLPATSAFLLATKTRLPPRPCASNSRKPSRATRK